MRAPGLLAVLLLAALPLAALPARADRLVAVEPFEEVSRELRRAGARVEERLPDGRLLVRVGEDALARLAPLRWEPVAPDARTWFRRRALALRRAGPFTPFEDVAAELRAVAAAHPDLVTLETLGRTAQGRELLAARVHGGTDDAVPAVLVDGAHHGDEPMGAEICLRLLRWLVAGADPDAVAAAHGLAVWILPVTNPDGYAAAERENSQGVDLNRNHGFMWGGEGGEPWSQPESRAVHDLAVREQPPLALSFHTADVLVNVPWNHTRRRPPDAALVEAVGREYAGLANYRFVWGYNWYQTLGDADDALYGALGGLHFTIETSSLVPDAVWARNLPALRAWLARARTGLRGRVLDAHGAPLAASVRVDGGRPFFARADGWFHRPLPAGEHSVVVSAGAHESAGATVVVADGAVTPLEIALAAAEGWYARAVAQISYDDAYDDSTGPDVLVALGAPDGIGFPLASGGSLVVDLGPGSPLERGGAAALRVHEAGVRAHRYDVFLSASEYGPWEWAGTFSGTATVAPLPLAAARFVRIDDAGAAARAGLVLDAVEVLTRWDGDAGPGPADAGAEPDAGPGDAGPALADAGLPDAGAPGDAGKSGPGAPVDRGGGGDAGGCGCHSSAAMLPALLPMVRALRRRPRSAVARTG